MRKGTLLAYVRWFDSAIYKGEPCQPEDLTGFLDNESAGVLVQEDKEKITLALDRCIDTNDVRLGNAQHKANVRKIRRFRV